MKKMTVLMVAMLFFSGISHALDKKAEKGVKYKRSKKIDFESLLIQGDKKRAEILVVTGDANDDLGGLLRLRENFHDHQAQDFGEEVR